MRDNASGFTLIEVVVALALLGLLLGGLYSLFAGSIGAWQKAESRAELEQNLRLVTRFITSDLENISVNADALIAGASDEESGGYLQFVSASTKPAYGSIVEIMYQVTDSGLTRQVRPAPSLSGGGVGVLEDEILSPMIRRLEPYFLIAGEWMEELPQEESQPPEAVRVVIWAGEGEDENLWRQRTIEVNLRAASALPVGGTSP